MNIIFAGTPDFASRHLEIVMGSKHHISCALTQPDRQSGRGMEVNLSSVKTLAIKEKIEIFQPKSLKNDEVIDKIKYLKPDLMLVVAYGLLIPKPILDIPSLGCINIHASILPRWRGASPMEYSILNGDKKIGLSYMQMSEGLDEGPVYEIHECDLDPEDNLPIVEEKLIQLSEINLNKFLDKIEKNEINHKSQNDEMATFAPKINKDFLQIDWKGESSLEIIRKINALSSKYGTFTHLNDKRVKIHKAKNYQYESSLAPGAIKSSDEGMIVSCKDGTALIVDTIQMQGKNMVTGKEFIRGYANLIEAHKNFNSANQ